MSPAPAADHGSRGGSAHSRCAATAGLRAGCGEMIWGFANGSYRAGHLNAREAFDLMADAYIVVILDRDAALRTGPHFVHVVLETAQRLECTFEDHHVVAQHPDRIVAANVAVRHDATGN